MERTEDKFYIPEIDEFCMDFKYERNEPHRVYYKENSPVEFKWVKHKWDEREIKLGKLRCEIFEKNIRVKYLDKSDIESLGFEEIGEEVYCFLGKESDWNLEKIYNNNIKSFYRIRNANKTQILFLEIKNKNELGKLLKQINIK